MDRNDIPMIPGRKSAMPRIYGDTPTFLGCPVVTSKKDINNYDVVVLGVPWEGTITWGSYTGCELAPKSVRHAAARYGGFLPEYGIDLFDFLQIGDYGDASVEPSSPENTMKRIAQKARVIYRGGAVPFSIGGDHSYTPEMVRALCECTSGKIGIIHFDAHMDNSSRFGNDMYPRCGPLYRVAQLEGVKTSSIVHVGIRGPRNTPAQVNYARDIGAQIFTIKDIHDLGIEEIIKRAILTAFSGTDAVYVTICSDVVEAAFNPGGAADFDGLTPRELFYALHELGKAGIAGLDFVEIYPIQDTNSITSHLASWAFIHALVGMALKKQAETEGPKDIAREVSSWKPKVYSAST